ncbi:MAG: S-adenosylmethionine:tRNA ribosyltransferase-isomerase [Bacteroidetes bacterium]|nr:S-adenosylmethionine:tRNA ribosyltransferase-isomerase [Bacteroidota bacterium]
MKRNPGSICISDFDYNLPPDKISQFPLNQRDESKLLLYKDGSVTHTIFRNIARHLPANSLIIFNNTRVIQARLFFQKPFGARIEIFCLEPVEPVADIQSAFWQFSPVVWKCLIGHSKRWQKGQLSCTFNHKGRTCILNAERLSAESNPSSVKFFWEPADMIFSEILDAYGLTPLPPYIQRDAGESDKLRYQTIYATQKGSVAAPTAGLHFTKAVFDSLETKGIETAFLTLHVGLGTFKPVTTLKIGNHVMHSECVSIPVDLIRKLSRNDNSSIIAVGTTTVRALESLYGFGVKLTAKPENTKEFFITQWDPYQKWYASEITLNESLHAVLNYCDTFSLKYLTGMTQLLIAPGYHFRLTDIMLTNFHQPKSTLLLLVAAFIGDNWKMVYDYALEKDFRFLSYGDSALLYKRITGIAG